VLFDAGDKNRGIFLICSGTVCLHMPKAPHLDRTFSVGSMLRLPSTFVGRPYSLTAVCVTKCEVAHVGKKKFLELMARRPVLCRHATDILAREMAFILSALGQRSNKTGMIRATKGRQPIADRRMVAPPSGWRRRT